jgi:hypothetical protein
MCVASGVSITRTISNSTRDGNTSNSDLLHRTPSHQYRAGRVPLVHQLSGRPGRPEELPSGVTNHSCNLSKPSPPGLPGSSFGPAMYPSRDIDM